MFLKSLGFIEKPHITLKKPRFHLKMYFNSDSQGRTGQCGNAAIAAKLFFRECEAFLKNAWHFKDISENLRLF
jgi:hypothetical protein